MSSSAIAFRAAAESTDRSVSLGRYWRSRPLVFSFEPHAYLADDEHDVLLQRSHFERGNETLDSNTTLVCHFRDGKISEFWLSNEDADAVDAFLGSAASA